MSTILYFVQVIYTVFNSEFRHAFQELLLRRRLGSRSGSGNNILKWGTSQSSVQTPIRRSDLHLFSCPARKGANTRPRATSTAEARGGDSKALSLPSSRFRSSTIATASGSVAVNSGGCSNHSATHLLLTS